MRELFRRRNGVAGSGADAGTPGRRGSRWAIAARLAMAATLVTLIVVYRRDLLQSLSALGNLSVTWILAALGCEAVSFMAFALSRWRLLSACGRAAGAGAVTAITCAANALSMSVPFAGPSLSVLYDYRQFRRHGVDPATIGWALAVSGIFTTSALAFLLAAGAVASGTPASAAAGLAAAALYVTPGAAILTALRYERLRKAVSHLAARLVGACHRLARRSATRAGTRNRPADGPGALAGLLRGFAGRLEGCPAALEGFVSRVARIRLPLSGYAEVLSLAILNWAAECGALVCAILATGQPVPWQGLLLAFGAGAAAGSTALSPGGLGIVEITLAAMLAASGLTASGALAAVLAYRMINYWLVLITGWAVMLILSRRGKAADGRSVSGVPEGRADGCPAR